MFTTETRIRVRYGETDQMGYVYYGRYAEYYEVGRTEMIRQLGMTYRYMEEKGVLLPVVNLTINYKRPARYDDLITIKTTLREMPTARITFHYEIFNEAGDLLNHGHAVLVFTDPHSRRPTRPPEELMLALQPFFV